MFERISKEHLVELNALHRTYLDELCLEFSVEFPDPPNKGTQLWEEFLSFFRQNILLPSDWRSFLTYKPPSELISQFREWKVANLEAQLAAFKPARTDDQRPQTSFGSQAFNPVADFQGVGNITESQDRDIAQVHSLPRHSNPTNLFPPQKEEWLAQQTANVSESFRAAEELCPPSSSNNNTAFGKIRAQREAEREAEREANRARQRPSTITRFHTLGS